jgi:hypothetical protein
MTNHFTDREREIIGLMCQANLKTLKAKLEKLNAENMTKVTIERPYVLKQAIGELEEIGAKCGLPELTAPDFIGAINL